MTHVTSPQAPESSKDLRSRLYSRENGDENHRLRKVIKHVQCCVMFVLDHEFSS